MKYEIYELMNNIHAELRDASVMFRMKNSDESVEIWKSNEYRKAERLFENAIRMIQDLETFFCEGDELLPQEELERLEREQLEELVAEAMLENEG